MNAFRVSLRQNDSYAFREYPDLSEAQRVHQSLIPDMSGISNPNFHRCQECGELTSKWDEPLLGLIIKNAKYDISITYDGVIIASAIFTLAYTARKLSGLVFRQLPDDDRFFSVHAARGVAFDAEKRKTRFINPCTLCGRYESVVGAIPVLLKAGSEVEGTEFVRTDLEFGSGDEKHPVLICGDAAATALADAKLKGLDLILI